MLEHMHYWVDLTYLSICSMNAMTSSEGINRCSSMSRWLAWQMHLIQKLQLFYNKNCCCVFYKKFTLRISLGLFTAIFFFNGNHRLIVCVTCWSWWLKYKFSPKKVRKLSSIKNVLNCCDHQFSGKHNSCKDESWHTFVTTAVTSSNLQCFIQIFHTSLNLY